jgi:hypothetical protein
VTEDGSSGSDCRKSAVELDLFSQGNRLTLTHLFETPDSRFYGMSRRCRKSLDGLGELVLGILQRSAGRHTGALAPVFSRPESLPGHPIQRVNGESTQIGEGIVLDEARAVCLL